MIGRGQKGSKGPKRVKRAEKGQQGPKRSQRAKKRGRKKGRKGPTLQNGTSSASSEVLNPKPHTPNTHIALRNNNQNLHTNLLQCLPPMASQVPRAEL